MNVTATVLVSLAVFFISGCNLVTMCDPMGVEGSGTSQTQHRETANFTSVDVSGAYDVEITCGQKNDIQIIGDDNIVPLISTTVKENTLYISHDGSIHPKTKLRVVITVGDINQVSSSGASNIAVRGIHNEEFDIDVSGAGSFYASGETGKLSVDLSGATDVDTKDLRAKAVTIDVSGASDAEVFASEELSAEVSGVGNITYYGNPQTVNQEVSGVGSIRKK